MPALDQARPREAFGPGARDYYTQLSVAARTYGPRIVGWGLPFVLVLYLGLRGGGYDAVVRGEIGIAVWWIVLLGALLGVLPSVRLGTAAWAGLAGLGAIAVWTTLGIGWSESAERSATEMARLAMYLGVFVLALSVQRGEGLRRTVNGLAAGLALIGIFALLSRLHPAWFPDNEVAKFQPSASERLSYPVNYWNGLAALMAMALPLLLSCAIHCRSVVSRALASAAVPAVALTAFYTLSRGGAIECAAGVLALLLLTRRRLALLPALLISALGSGILIAAATQRDALADGLLTPAAASQGDTMLAMVLVVCAGVALVQVAIALADKYGLVKVRIAREWRRTGLAIAAVVTAVAIVGVGIPAASDGWQDFKDSSSGGSGAERFTSVSGNGRYQYWSGTVDQNESSPLTGTGPGTFEYWWARDGSIPSFVRDAHSLYMESLGELGWVGFLLIAGFVLGVIGTGAWRSLRGPREARTPRAAATAAAVAFAVAAGVDWAWELTVLPIAFLFCAAVILARPRDTAMAPDPRDRQQLPARIGFAVLALVALAAIAIPLASTVRVRESQADVRADDPGAALERTRSAADLQPYAATPKLQEALVLELTGDLAGARSAAAAATDKESTNWRTWLVLSRLEAELNHPGAAVAAYRKARELNPRSPLFATEAAQ